LNEGSSNPQDCVNIKMANMIKNKCNISDKKDKKELVKKTGDAFLSYITGAPAETVSKSIDYFAFLKNNIVNARLEHFFNVFVKQYYEDEDVDRSKTVKLYRQLSENPKFESELYDFCESVRKTDSELARATLALIYCDYYKTKAKTDLFLKKACKSLSEITDEVLEFFLKYLENIENKEWNEGEEGYDFTKTIVLKNPSELDFIITQELKQRRLVFLESGLRWGPSTSFCITEQTLRFQEYILKAKKIVDLSKKF
jgi:hypothetical protein